MTTVETIREGFTFLTIARQRGLPTYSVINDNHQKLNSHPTSIQSELGGRAHGLLGLILPAGTYQTRTGVAFSATFNPGPVPTIPTGATGPQISALKRGHKYELHIFPEFNATNNNLKQQLLGCFDESYIHGLLNRHTGYDNAGTLQMLTHLYTTHGVNKYK